MKPKPQNDKDEPLGRYKRRRCCCCSMCCCCVITVVVVLVLVAVGLLLFFLLARMLMVKMVDVQPPWEGGPLFTQESSLGFNFDIRFDVDNPNYLTLGVNQLEGTGYWPSLPDVPMDNVTLRDIIFEKQATTTLNFPLTMTYDPSKDPQHKVFNDLMDKCGFTGTRSQLTVDYEVKVYFKIIVVSKLPRQCGITLHLIVQYPTLAPCGWIS